MSELEQLEEAYSQLVEFVKELENDPDDDAPAATEPSNDEPIPSKAVEVVMQATNKVVKSLCMFHEFEMVLQDKIASLHIISNELMLTGLHLQELNNEIAETRKKANKDNYDKLFESCEPFVASIEELETVAE
uniref:uncharacterized protein LOC120949586 n=1 Tax=Anopheles coluzzii TaxID=1518534 RepID=UPI0020FFF096|nr:uncharacterized protein LOC120949586 [Anopheles coluzzii]